MLQVRRLVAGYGAEVPILNGLDMDAREGAVTLIIGPNGAGKSTLLKAIYGYVRCSSGEISVGGKRVTGTPPDDMLRAGVGYLMQGRSVFPSMSVRDNLRLGAWIIRHDRAAVEKAFDSVFARFPRLKTHVNRPAGLLSGGEQRAVEIARLTMTGPRILLLDEPSVGLMPRLVDEVYADIERLKSERFTIVLVDQNVRKGMEISDYVYTLKLGRNHHKGTQKEISANLPNIVREWL